jgi:hypothetical protein
VAKKTTAKMQRLAQETPLIRANANREETKAENFVSMYINDTQIQITPWDFRFIFGLIETPPMVVGESKTILVKTIGEIRMSPQHAKTVAMVLLQQVKRYEENVGPIPMPPMVEP